MEMGDRLGDGYGEKLVEMRWLDNVRNRLDAMEDAADQIPGDDLAEYRDAVSEQSARWEDCLGGPLTSVDQRDRCSAEEDELRRALEDLYFLVSE